MSYFNCVVSGLVIYSMLMSLVGCILWTEWVTHLGKPKNFYKRGTTPISFYALTDWLNNVNNSISFGK